MGHSNKSGMIREKHVDILAAYFKLLETDKRAKDVARMKLYEEVGEKFYISARHCGLIIRKAMKDPMLRKDAQNRILYGD